MTNYFSLFLPCIFQILVVLVHCWILRVLNSEHNSFSYSTPSEPLFKNIVLLTFLIFSISYIYSYCSRVITFFVFKPLFEIFYTYIVVLLGNLIYVSYLHSLYLLLTFMTHYILTQFKFYTKHFTLGFFLFLNYYLKLFLHIKLDHRLPKKPRIIIAIPY